MTGFFSHHWQPSQKACVRTYLPHTPSFSHKKNNTQHPVLRLLVHWLIPDVTDLLIGPHLQRQRGSPRLDIFATCRLCTAQRNKMNPPKKITIMGGRDFRHEPRFEIPTGPICQKKKDLPGYRKTSWRSRVMDYHSRPPKDLRSSTRVYIY